MISITIPDDDICIKPDEHMKLPKGQGGIYQFVNIEGKILYIGKASELRQRVRQHMNYYGNLEDVAHNFSEVRCFYVNDPVERDIYETWLINTIHPPLNVEKTFTYRTERYDLKWLTEENRLQAIREEEERLAELREKKRQSTFSLDFLEDKNVKRKKCS